MSKYISKYFCVLLQKYSFGLRVMYPKLSFTKLLTFIKVLGTNAVWLVIPLGDVHLSLTSVNSAAVSIVSV